MKTIFITLFGFLSISFGALLNNIPLNLLQSDGSKISCFSSGDEYYVRLHDAQDFTIIQDTHDGFYYYAQLINNHVVPTVYRADKPLPETVNLQPEIYISKEEYLHR